MDLKVTKLTQNQQTSTMSLIAKQHWKYLHNKIIKFYIAVIAHKICITNP